jgi:hypothetical protein
VPPISALLRKAEGRLPRHLLGRLWAIKTLRDEVLHGAAPLFIEPTVSRIRAAHKELSDYTGRRPEGDVGSLLAATRDALCSARSEIDHSKTCFVRDLYRLVDLEVILRAHLAESGVAVRNLMVIECAHELLADRNLRGIRLPGSLLRNLRGTFIIRNHLAHGMIVRLSDVQARHVEKTERDLTDVIAAAEFVRGGRKASVGDFGTSLAL